MVQGRALAQMPGHLDLGVVDLIPGGVVAHGLERYRRTAQQIGGYLGCDLFVGDQVVHGLDLPLRRLRLPQQHGRLMAEGLFHLGWLVGEDKAIGEYRHPWMLQCQACVKVRRQRQYVKRGGRTTCTASISLLRRHGVGGALPEG
jgi:hypothetical protein